MAENISIVGKDYRTVAMENAYDLVTVPQYKTQLPDLSQSPD